MIKPGIKVLLVAGSEDGLDRIRQMLAERGQDGYELDWAPTAEQGLDRLGRETYDVVLLDHGLFSRGEKELLRLVSDRSAGTPVIVLTETWGVSVDLSGAMDVLDQSQLTAALLERSIQGVLLTRKLQQAEEAGRIKDYFLASLSHELRTPMTPVMMLLTALQDDETLPQSVREDLHMMYRNVRLQVH